MPHQRIIIIGGSGSGKSTLASRIAAHTHYPVYHLDNLLLNPDWSQKPKSDWLSICEKEFLSKDTGIVDGNYASVLNERIEWADLIIFIDVPAYRQLWSVLKRTILVNLKLEKREGSIEERKEGMSFDFFMWILNWNRDHRKELLARLETVKDTKVVVTRKPRGLDIGDII